MRGRLIRGLGPRSPTHPGGCRPPPGGLAPAKQALTGASVVANHTPGLRGSHPLGTPQRSPQSGSLLCRTCVMGVRPPDSQTLDCKQRSCLTIARSNRSRPPQLSTGCSQSNQPHQSTHSLLLPPLLRSLRPRPREIANLDDRCSPDRATSSWCCVVRPALPTQCSR